MLPAHVLNWASSPQKARGMRSAWPLAEVPHSPTIAGIPRHHAVPRFRGLPQPPSPTRLVQSSNQAGPSPLRDRDVATPASSYTSRPSAADTRREDEEHGATQVRPIGHVIFGRTSPPPPSNARRGPPLLCMSSYLHERRYRAGLRLVGTCARSQKGLTNFRAQHKLACTFSCMK